jgi:hypothetical protein
MNTKKLFTVTVSDTKRTNGAPVKLVVPRTSVEVAQLKAKFETVEAKPHTKSEPPPVSFGDTIRALVSLYRRCEHDGAVELARRTQRALVILLGPQRHLRDDEDAEAVIGVAEHTLRGLGGGK